MIGWPCWAISNAASITLGNDTKLEITRRRRQKKIFTGYPFKETGKMRFPSIQWGELKKKILNLMLEENAQDCCNKQEHFLKLNNFPKRIL